MPKAPKTTSEERKTDAQECERHLTSQKIANLYPRATLQERAVTSILQKDGVPNIRQRGYPLTAATEAIILYYKRGFEARDVAGEGDRARKNRADADKAEMEAQKLAGTLVSRDDYVNNYADAIAQGVRAIERLPDLTGAQKDRVIAALREVRLPDLEES